MKKKGILYVNLGTPRSPATGDVARYLREFLMDPFVIDIAAPLRALLVYGVIVPFRSRRSAEAYRKIWTTEGSPLLVNSRALVEAVRAQLASDGNGDTLIELGMRYGEPSIEAGVRSLLASGVGEIQVLPAYPQYALSSTETALAEVRRVAEAVRGVRFTAVRSFETQSDFIFSVSASVAKTAAEFRPDFYLFSYHGLPVRHLNRLNVSCGLKACASVERPGAENCYRCQCFRTTAALVRALGLKEGQYATSFQSRLSDRWIKPYTDDFYKSLPKEKSVKRLLVACPSFTADCLETLEEIQIRGREDFIRAGGEDLRLAPCPNASPSWVRAVLKICDADGSSPNASAKWEAL